MRTIRVRYEHEEGSGWTAESPDAPDYLAYGATFEEVRRLAPEGLPKFIDEPVVIYDPTLQAAVNRARGAELQQNGAAGRRIPAAQGYPPVPQANRNAA